MFESERCIRTEIGEESNYANEVFLFLESRACGYIKK